MPTQTRTATKKAPPAQDRKRLDELLDEGLKETFPASDTPFVIRPDHRTPEEEEPRAPCT